MTTRAQLRRLPRSPVTLCGVGAAPFRAVIQALDLALKQDEEMAKALAAEDRVLSERFVQQENKDKKLATKLQKLEVKPIIAEAKKFKKAWYGPVTSSTHICMGYT